MSLLKLPTELFQLIAAQLPRGAVFNLILTCRVAYHLAREFLFHDVVLGQEGISHAFLAAVTTYKISDLDLRWVRRLTIPSTMPWPSIFFDEFLSTVLPRLHHLRQVNILTPSKESPHCFWIKAPVLATLPAGVRVSVKLSASVSVSELLELPLLLQRPETIVELSIDIRHITSKQQQPIYDLLPTFSNLQNLTVTTLAEHIRPRERQLLAFNFINTGMRFCPSRFPAGLTHLNFYPSLTSAPPLPSTLTSLILHMPRVSHSLVSAIFSLRHLETLHIVEPLSLLPALSSAPLPPPSFHGLKTLALGNDTSWPPANRHHYHCHTLPPSFLPLILSTNRGLKSLHFSHLSDPMLSLLPAGLRELSALFTFDHTCQQRFSMAVLTGALARCKALRKCWLPFSVVMAEGQEVRYARIDMPLLRAVVLRCPSLEELKVVDMDSDFRTDRARWEKDAAREMCADEATYKLLEGFFTVGSDTLHPAIVQCGLDKAGLEGLKGRLIDDHSS